ncbi:zinc metallochaperone AztD [Gordonia sp. NPDC003376]
MQKHRTKLTHSFALALVGAFALAACGSDGSDPAASSSSAASGPEAEQQSATPRLALSYDGGVLVYDAETLEQVADIPVEGFVRLNSADNGRDVFVSEADGFHVLDMGTWTRKHGDHGHHYTTEPQMTEMRFGGTKPGHVVSFDDRLTLFSDGTGEVTVVEPVELAQGNAKSTSYTVPEAHHGVAVARGDGSLVVTIGNEESRSGIVILDKDRHEITRFDQCPGIHGEAAAADGVLTFGCEDGILIVRGDEIRKVDAPDPYGRIGNQAGSEGSAIVLGDYKTDADAETEHPNRFTLTDTRTAQLKIVPFDASYSFRGIKRGPGGEALILGTDGALHVFDPETGTQTRTIPLIGAWTEPAEWQEAMPNLFVLGDEAFVTEPDTRTLVRVDLGSGEVSQKATLPKETIELTGVTG